MAKILKLFWSQNKSLQAKVNKICKKKVKKAPEKTQCLATLTKTVVTKEGKGGVGVNGGVRVK